MSLSHCAAYSKMSLGVTADIRQLRRKLQDVRGAKRYHTERYRHFDMMELQLIGKIEELKQWYKHTTAKKARGSYKQSS